MKKRTENRIRFITILVLIIALGVAIITRVVSCEEKQNNARLVSITIIKIARGEDIVKYVFNCDEGIWLEWYTLDYLPLDNTGTWLYGGEGAMQQSHTLPPEKWQLLFSALEECKYQKWDRDYIGVSADIDESIYSLCFHYTEGEDQNVTFMSKYPDNITAFNNALHGVTGTTIFP
jgi:hypothetical protein